MTQPRRCNGRNRAGEPCRLAPIKGGAVCRVHGGSAPQVKKAAAERLAEMVEPALVQLQRLMESADTDAVKLAAVKDILDRAGYKPKERIAQETEGRQVIEIVYTHPDRQDPAAPAAPGPAPDQG